MFCPEDLQQTGHLHSLAIAKINSSSSDYYIAIFIAVCSKKIEINFVNFSISPREKCVTITTSFYTQTPYLSTMLPVPQHR